MAARIQLRRDTAANWTSSNPTLADGEFGYEKDTGKLKVGDGTTAWTGLSYNRGTLAGQDATSVNIDGGAIDSTTLGATTPAAASATSLNIVGGSLSVTHSGVNLVTTNSTAVNGGYFTFQKSGVSHGYEGAATNFGYSSPVANSHAIYAVGDLYLSGGDQVAAYIKLTGTTAELIANNVLIGTTDGDGTPAVGRLTVKGSSNDGSTNVQVWRDSDEANVASLDTNGNLVVAATVSTGGYTVATLPAGATGMRSYVTDATAPTYNAVLTGSGAVVVPAFYNGAAWVSA